MHKLRKEHIEKSNNANNPNKNICAYHVCEALGVANKVRYLHILHDVVRAARKKWDVRSRKSALKPTTVGALRKKASELAWKEPIVAFIVYVEGHVLLLNQDGETMVDTDPRSRDKRRVLKVFAVFPKGMAPSEKSVFVRKDT